MFFSGLLAVSATAQSYVDQYNVVWNSQSANSSESMPCGGGDIGLNVWVENGDLLFYVSQSGTFDENNTLLKLGRVRVKLTPNLLNGSNFRQELKLRDGYVRIEAGEGSGAVGIDLWVDVFRPVVHLEINAQQAVAAEVGYENWRYRSRELRGSESNQNSYKWAAPKGLKTSADCMQFMGDKLLFYHTNRSETVFDVTVAQQGLDSVKHRMMNPLKNRIFGGVLSGQNMEPAGIYNGEYQGTDYCGWLLKSRYPSENHSVLICLRNSQNELLDVDWFGGVMDLLAEAKRTPDARQQTQGWWNRYWERSFIVINPERPDSEGWRIGRNYQLFRYMLGCNAFGEWPTKFNGGLFTYDPVFTNESYAYTPDFRNWGGGTHTAQNQRLVYFPMLKSGDWEMMASQFDFYNRSLANAELRSEVYWGHAGAAFTEQLENYGLPNPSEYGWRRPEGYDPGMEYNAWLEYQWDTALEFCLMILETRRYAGADISAYLPLVESCLAFFDEHYRYLARQRGVKELNEAGQLVLYPGSACETYKMAYDAVSTVAGLQALTDALLALDESLLPAEKRAHWEAFRATIPPIGFRELDGRRTIAPARLWERINNTETPQLYPVFPWRQFGVGRPDLETAVNTYLYDPDALKFRGHVGWKQDAIWAACLGLTEEARRLVVGKLDDSGRRFPAFWGPGFDWTPDHNWGGSGMVALQEMALQEVDGELHVLPAWPEEWDVRFRLHAPEQRVVEVEKKNGQAPVVKAFSTATESDAK